MRALAIVILLLLLLYTRISEACPADTAAAPRQPRDTTVETFDITARLANESNWADGILGPVTYGIIVETARDPFELDATFIRMHEPGMATFNSVLDEGQLTLKYSISDVTTVSGTYWKNRMMDMYTTVGGFEVQRTYEPLSVAGGVYAGSASRFEIDARYLGAGLEFGVELGDLELSLSHFAGLIHMPNDPSSLGIGKYHKSGFEAGYNFSDAIHFPLRGTLGIERRYFEFGAGGPASEPIDTWIVVLGAEVFLTSLFGPS